MTTERPGWRRLYPFESHWFDAAGGRLHYLDEGPGKGSGTGNWGLKSLEETKSKGCSSSPQSPAPSPLLFVHGNPTWSFYWRRLVQRFSGRFRCIAIDHLGCGLSDKPERAFRLADHIDHLTSLIDHLGLDQITLVAQDWGGAIGLGALLRQPNRLKRIVLFNTGAFPPPYIPWRIAVCRWPIVGRLAVQGGNLFARAAMRMTLGRTQSLDPLVVAGCLAPYDTWAHRRQIYEFIDDIPRSPRHPTWHTLTQIEAGLPQLAEVPSLLVWGMQDWCFRPDCLEKFVDVWPNAKVHRLADVGHWVVEDAPDEALALVDNFLQGQGAESDSNTLNFEQ